MFFYISVWKKHDSKSSSLNINKEELTVGMPLGCRSVSLVIPDDFAVLAGDVKLEHVPTFCALYELKRNLRSKRERTSTLHQVKL